MLAVYVASTADTLTDLTTNKGKVAESYINWELLNADWVMLKKSVLNYYSHFSSLFPDFFFAIVLYSSRRIVSDKKNHVTLKNNLF